MVLDYLSAFPITSNTEILDARGAAASKYIKWQIIMNIDRKIDEEGEKD